MYKGLTGTAKSFGVNVSEMAIHFVINNLIVKNSVPHSPVPGGMQLIYKIIKYISDLHFASINKTNHFNSYIFFFNKASGAF